MGVKLIIEHYQNGKMGNKKAIVGNRTLTRDYSKICVK
jgi:hypothetical protein